MAKRQGWQIRRSVLTGAGLATGAALGVAAPAFGASQDFTVNQLGDAGDGTCDASCTLRDAVDDANANAGQYDYIFFSGLSGTIALATGQIPITDAVYIYGPGPDQLAVSAAPNNRIFDVNPVNPGDVVEIDGLNLTGGDSSGNGGAIQNDDARLHVVAATFTGNTAILGGAIYEAGAYADGVDDRIVGATFHDNHADGGGAMYADSSWGVVRLSTFSGNGASDGYGGAIAGGTGGYLIDSTVSGNDATVAGGGVSALDYIDMYGTVLANNTSLGSNPDLYAFDGNVAFDLVEDPGTTGIDGEPSIISGQDPQLGPLQNNGGYTETLKPAASSPVVDQSYSYSYTDQRGSERIVDNPNRANAATGIYAAADIGSVELTLAEGPQATPSTPLTPPVVPKKKKKCKKKKKHRSAGSAKKQCKKKKKKKSSATSHGFRFHMPRTSAPRWPDAAHPFRLGPSA